MAHQGQLEIINLNGEIEFYPLDAEKGVTNIGRHPENDIVLDDAGVAPFHAMLDHRQKPYQIIVLAQEGETVLEDEPLPPNIATTLQNWNNIKLGSYTLILVEDVSTTSTQSPSFAATSPGGTFISTGAPGPAERPATRPMPPAPAPPPRPLPVRPIPLAAPTSRPEESTAAGYGPGAAERAVTGARPNGIFRSRPADQSDEVIVTNLSETDWVVDVEQTALGQLTITNGGDIVAAFSVAVQGLDEEWVDLSQSYVNLYEGESATVSITVTPPRLASSRAGAHHFAIIVTSPNYPGRMSQRGATLNINPYYEFAVDELSPKRQTISWSNHVGETTIPVLNKGNSSASFRLEGSDEERMCSFEFDVPGEVVPLATQAELVLQPEESIAVPISITPRKRRLIGFRKHRYGFTVTTSLVDAQLTPRSVLGELYSKALIGPWLLLLTGLLLVILLLFLARPRINLFMFSDGGQTKIISNGTPVAIRWEASIFTTDRTIEASPGTIEELEEPAPRRGLVETFPKTNTVYTFFGGNILSRFAPSIFPPPVKTLEVRINPIAPEVNFEVDKTLVVDEEAVTLSWQVQNADKIELFRRVGDAGAIEFVGDFSNQPVSAIQATPEPNQPSTTYILVASNAYVPTPTPLAQRVNLQTPTPTASPTPAIVLFNANPQTINEGEASRLTWLVNGVQEVAIQGIDGSTTFPASYEVEVRPTASTDYILTVPGVPPVPVRVNVIPATPTPTTTPEPLAPEITFFVADPDEIVKNDSTEVELAWTVVGTTTNVELSSPELPSPLSNLQNEGSFIITLEDTALFILTAFNGPDKKTSASVQVDAVDATPTPVPPTATPIPAQILDFKIIAPGAPEVVEVSANPRVYQVQKNVNVTFQWQTNNAANKVIFTEPGGAAEVGTVPVGQVQKTITVGGNYTLVAENAEGQQSSPRLIQIQLVAPPPPDPPFNVLGVEDAPGNKNTITWNWTFNPSKSDIVGYRIYRATIPGGTFSLVPGADESALQKNSPRQFVDSVTPTCGRAYYVVAVYLDLQGVPQESAVSTNSWNSTPCP